jgi:hypothetical protein
MNEANTSLGTNGNTTAAGAVRNYQTALKDALDRGNNNQSVYVLGPVIFVPPY